MTQTLSATSSAKHPRHLAIIMDGNGRWAKKRHLPRMLGHQEGLKVVRKIVKTCGEKGVEALTLFAFSSENWQRPPQEVNHLMTLFLNTLKGEIEKLNQNNVQLRMVGSLKRFKEPLRQWIEKSQQLTAKNTGLKLIIAVDYSGQWDIIQAVQALAQQVKTGTLQAEDITQDLFARYLSLSDLPPPDLLIRTSGEYRISNFLLWQLAYTELYFTETLWPDFNEEELHKAFLFYSQRERRFGYTSEQLSELNA
ncbi:isoprenyl transferase [Rickettsiella endosymbiont of Dermanyssus gallinae]|uniref:isoprenyl transferase n=1 Tax=Rickettsiella endosymbiont of Dermanyssus gallinae TaxID=2856608 RepID=UPI001C531B28|nr:isoprenyl transferase [Rickettsiella endosymbiont of Dermanyssus gallinae]